MLSTDKIIRQVSIHSAQITAPSDTLFVALPGKISDGHLYLSAAYDAGVRAFVITDISYLEQLPACDILVVSDAQAALQSLARHHRSVHHQLSCLGITGSNGKTVVKEWLYQLLCDSLHIVKSPKSYNSQIGVPLSIFQISHTHDLGIFEAGISKPGEMQAHADMIRPQIGIITNIGDAHDAGFSDRTQKAAEKLTLFESTTLIIYSRDHSLIHEHVVDTYPNKSTLTWGTSQEADIVYTVSGNQLTIQYQGTEVHLQIPFVDRASVENIMHCLSFVLYQEIPLEKISQRLSLLSSIDMRLEMKAGIHNSIVINDAYSADLSSLSIAIDFMNRQGKDRSKVLVLSALDQSGMSESDVLRAVRQLLTNIAPVDCLYLTATASSLLQGDALIKIFARKGDLLQHLAKMDLADKTVLVKGARKDRLEDIVYQLSNKGHSTRLTVNLDALEHNIRIYRSHLKKETKIIAVVKAAAYGSGSIEIARTLSRSGISYLAVAFVDEAISLRRQGIQMPIIVFNADLMSMRDVLQYDLELEIYTLPQLQQLSAYLAGGDSRVRIHLKLDTGMHRLGFTEAQLPQVLDLLSDEKQIVVKSVFSHLASSEDADDDDYTLQQFALFDKLYREICSTLHINPLRHILNSSGISRFKERQYEMVRLGLGLYGIDGGGVLSDQLRKVHTLTSRLLQIKQLYKGDSVGYNRKTVLEADTLTGVVNIGYADGLMRNVGNRAYALLIEGKKAPILGTVSMDLVIVDLTAIDRPIVGMDVVIFDAKHSIEGLAAVADTIPYEILSRISERVERVYISQ